MPVHLLGDTSSPGRSNIRFDESAPRRLHIGLINNMPDQALKATERQFLSLLDSVAGDSVVHLSLFALPDVPRAESGCRHVNRFYSSIENLWDTRLDALIVTGTEPRAPNLTDEPYWGSLTKVLDWAEHNTPSAIWSCLAAHAGILHIDGIGRRRLSDKRFGVFEYARASDHSLMAGVPASLQMPQSRWNDIPGNELTDCGYCVLTRAKDGGVDAFLKQRKSLFVFFQGHPEYEANTLLHEYRRDVGRYLRRETDTYPSMPQSYFDRETADALTQLRDRALSDRRKELLADFPATLAEKRVASPWRPVAARIYQNWLEYLCAQKEHRLKQRRSRKPPARSKAEVK